MQRRPGVRVPRPLHTVLTAVAVLALAAGTLGCESLAGVVAEPEIRCGRFEGPGCSALTNAGRLLLRRVTEEPMIVAVDGACPPNARSMASALGGEEAAVVVRWPDGTTDWVTIPLPPDWPAGTPGAAVAQDGPPPEHLLSLVGAGD